MEKLNLSENKGAFSILEKIFIITMVLASFLYLYNIGSAWLWLDEVFTHYFTVDGSLKNIFYKDEDVFKVHPPLFYALSFAFHKVFSLEATEFTLRLLPFFSSLGYLVLSFLLTRRLFDTRTAVLSTLLIFSSGFYSCYAREARMYPTNIFFVLASILAYLNFRERPSKSRGAWYLLFSACSLLTHFSSLFYIGFLFAFDIISNINNIGASSSWRERKKVFVKFLIAQVAVYGLGVGYFFQKTLASNNRLHIFIKWIPEPSLETLKLFFEQILTAPLYSMKYELPFDLEPISFIYFAFASFSLILISIVLRKISGKGYLAALFLTGMALSPVLLSYVYFIFTGISAFFPRGFNVTIIFFFILLASFFTSVSLPGWKRFGDGIVIVFCGIIFHHNVVVNPFYAYEKDMGLEKTIEGIIKYNSEQPPGEGLTALYTVSPFKSFLRQMAIRKGLDIEIKHYQLRNLPDRFWLLRYWDGDWAINSVPAAYRTENRIDTRIEHIQAKLFIKSGNSGPAD